MTDWWEQDLKYVVVRMDAERVQDLLDAVAELKRRDSVGSSRNLTVKAVLDTDYQYIFPNGYELRDGIAYTNSR